MKFLLKAPKAYIALVVLFFCIGVAELVTLSKDQQLDVFAAFMLAIAVGLANLHEWSFKALKIFSVLYALINVPFLILGWFGGGEAAASANLFGLDIPVGYWLYFLVISAFSALQIYVGFWLVKNIFKHIHQSELKP